MRPLSAVLVLGLAVVTATSFALETDQYYAWGRPLADSTDAVNARLNLELERTIASFPDDHPPESCRTLAVAYRSRMRFLLLHEIQVWAWNSKWVDRIPNGGDGGRWLVTGGAGWGLQPAYLTGFRREPLNQWNARHDPIGRLSVLRKTSRTRGHSLVNQGVKISGRCPSSRSRVSAEIHRRFAISVELGRGGSSLSPAKTQHISFSDPRP